MPPRGGWLPSKTEFADGDHFVSGTQSGRKPDHQNMHAVRLVGEGTDPRWSRVPVVGTNQSNDVWDIEGDAGHGGSQWGNCQKSSQSALPMRIENDFDPTAKSRVLAVAAGLIRYIQTVQPCSDALLMLRHRLALRVPLQCLVPSGRVLRYTCSLGAAQALPPKTTAPK